MRPVAQFLIPPILCLAPATAASLPIAESDDSSFNLMLDAAEVRTEVVVTAITEPPRSLPGKRVQTERIEVLLGTGPSIHNRNAAGGGPLHAGINAEGGGLAFLRYTAGLQSTNVLSGVAGNHRFRNHSIRGVTDTVEARTDVQLAQRRSFTGLSVFRTAQAESQQYPELRVPQKRPSYARPVGHRRAEFQF